MNRIDRLILKAQAVVAPAVELSVALIERNGSSWTAEVHLSNGDGSTIKRATYATMEQAVEHIRAMAAEYPNSRDVPIIIDDLG